MNESKYVLSEFPSFFRDFDRPEKLLYHARYVLKRDYVKRVIPRSFQGTSFVPAKSPSPLFSTNPSFFLYLGGNLCWPDHCAASFSPSFSFSVDVLHGVDETVPAECCAETHLGGIGQDKTPGEKFVIGVALKIFLPKVFVQKIGRDDDVSVRVVWDPPPPP